MYAGKRGISETLGFVHMMRRAIMLRRGCGGLKHITVKALLVQEAVQDYSIEIARISRERCMLTSLPLHPVMKN